MPSTEDKDFAITCHVKDWEWDNSNTLVSMSLTRTRCDGSENIASIDENGRLTVGDTDLSCRASFETHVHPQLSNETKLTISTKG